jgi:hypothetical protein
MKPLIYSIITEKCPYCHKGDVFMNNKLISIPQMNPHCNNCKADFTGEPGYFFGAMYLSYAIAVGAGIITFLLLWYLLGIRSFNTHVFSIISIVLLISFKNFKWSRIIWLKIFPPGPGTNFSKAPDNSSGLAN